MNDDLASVLEAAANNASALEAVCDANGDEAGAIKANQAYNQLSDAAMKANATNAAQTLATTTDAQKQLTALIGQMDSITKQLAQSEANVQTFVAIGTQAANLAAALDSTPPNVVGGISAIASISKILGINE